MSDYVLKQFKGVGSESKARAAFQPGMYLYGYCCGHFGRDSYGKKLIIKITRTSIEVIENGCHNGEIRKISNSCDTTTNYFSWVELLESSNRDLEDPQNGQTWDTQEFD